MIALSVWYTLADIVLLLQILIYNKRNAKQLLSVKVDPSHLSPATPLLAPCEADEELPPYNHHHHHHNHNHHNEESLLLGSSNYSNTTHGTMDLERPAKNSNSETSSLSSSSSSSSDTVTAVSTFRTVMFNLFIVLGVFGAGIAGWYFSENRHPRHPPIDNDPSAPPSDPNSGLHFDFWGQIFGWGCAILYLGSRFPQILLNFRRKSVEGISFMFFLFACLGNLTYVISILALDLSPKYLLINGSWLAGSVGTLFLDMIIFVQFWIYNRVKADDDDDDDEEGEELYS